MCGVYVLLRCGPCSAVCTCVSMRHVCSLDLLDAEGVVAITARLIASIWSVFWRPTKNFCSINLRPWFLVHKIILLLELYKSDFFFKIQKCYIYIY